MSMAINPVATDVAIEQGLRVLRRAVVEERGNEVRARVSPVDDDGEPSLRSDLLGRALRIVWRAEARNRQVRIVEAEDSVEVVADCEGEADLDEAAGVLLEASRW
jgi:hypothetical protein